MIQTRIKKNRAYKSFYKDETEVIFVYGGGGSGKSVAVAQKHVERCLKEWGKKPHKFLALRKVQKDLDDSIVAEIKDVIDDYGISDEFHYHKTKKNFTHLPSGNQIFCRGLDEPERIKSIKGITGMWLEEASEFSKEEFDQLLIRIRGHREFYVQWICSFNPIDEDLWLREYIDRNKNNPHFKFYWTTYKDNRFLSKRDRERLQELKHTNPLFYDIYCLGLWGVVDKSGKFTYNFDQNIHVRDDIDFDKDHRVLWLSFDFNIDPMTCAVAQKPDNQSLYILDEIRLENSDIYQVLDRIKADYPGYVYIVTGDASGTNNTGMVRGKLNYWQTIVKYFKLTTAQIKKRNKNLGLIDSRILCNAALKTTNFAVHPRCENIIHDLKFAKVDDYGVLIKDRENNKNDHLDTVRYLLDANYPDIITRPKKYEKRTA